MVTVYYEEYTNDYNRRNKTKDFGSLAQFEDWFFGLCKRSYTEYIGIPDPDTAIFRPSEMPYALSVNAMWDDNCTYWIHMILRNNGIIFSDGKYTDRQKHWNDTTKDMCRQMLARRNNPTFNFV